MCGIAGIFNFDGKPVAQNELLAILNKMVHRGNDQTGLCFPEKEVGLAHRRLSIIDLNSNAAQPMSYAQNKLCLTYNGEIYNYLELRHFLQNKQYRFQTRSDSEVILAAYDYWQEDCVKHLNGMFAFAIWDTDHKKLFCARDPVGIKPFYYYHSKNIFAFASESLALNHYCQKSLNEQALTSYLMSMYVSTHESIFKSIYKLEPGYSLTIDGLGKMQQKKFWQINNVNQSNMKAASTAELGQIIQQAVKQQLQSDVPVGGFLSGGIDSGLITAMAAPLVKTYHTYSVGYEGMDNNELPYALKLAQRYGTKHTALTITANDALYYLNAALQKSSEPIADSAMVATYMLSQLAAQDGVKVLLNGTGGDEIFAGYTRYTGQLSLKRKLLLALPPAFLKAMAALPLKMKLASRLKHVELDMLYSTGGSFELARRCWSEKEFKSFLKTIAKELSLAHYKNLPLLYKRMLFDLHHYLPNELLFLLDQMTMAHTVEGRVPLLDINIIKAAYQFKAKTHVQSGTTKALLKQIALPFLGQAYIERKKQGFAASTYWWVKKNYTEFIEQITLLKKLAFFLNLNGILSIRMMP